MQWLSTIIGLLGLATLFGGVASVFWSARNKGIMELLRTENSAYKDSNQRLHEENIELKQSAASCEAELKMWRENVTQGPSIEKLITETQNQHKTYLTELSKVTTGLAKLVTQQSQLTETIAKSIGGKSG